MAHARKFLVLLGSGGVGKDYLADKMVERYPASVVKVASPTRQAYQDYGIVNEQAFFARLKSNPEEMGKFQTYVTQNAFVWFKNEMRAKARAGEPTRLRVLCRSPLDYLAYSQSVCDPDYYDVAFLREQAHEVLQQAVPKGACYLHLPGPTPWSAVDGWRKVDNRKDAQWSSALLMEIALASRKGIIPGFMSCPEFDIEKRVSIAQALTPSMNWDSLTPTLPVAEVVPDEVPTLTETADGRIERAG